jgi:uncharacterized protein DUF6636
VIPYDAAMSLSRPRTATVLAGMVLLALGACGSTNPATGTAGQPPGPQPSTAPALATSPASTPSLIIETVSGGTFLFVTPSGNIGCAVTGTNARCDIGDRSWTPPPKPATCQLDYGNGAVVDGTGARLSCAGDTLLHATTALLPYGHGVRDGQVLCVSQATGVRCEYVRTGHGFLLAKEGYTLF